MELQCYRMRVVQGLGLTPSSKGHCWPQPACSPCLSVCRSSSFQGWSLLKCPAAEPLHTPSWNPSPGPHTCGHPQSWTCPSAPLHRALLLSSFVMCIYKPLSMPTNWGDEQSSGQERWIWLALSQQRGHMPRSENAPSVLICKWIEKFTFFSQSGWVSPSLAKVSNRPADPTEAHWHPSLLRGRFHHTYLIGPSSQKWNPRDCVFSRRTFSHSLVFSNGRKAR